MKSTAEKLQIKPDTKLWMSPPGHAELVGELPSGVDTVDLPQDADAAIIFADDAESLRSQLADIAGDLATPSVLWVAYPKGNRTDINRDSLWPILREHGLRPISQISLGDVWSALRFRPLKPGEKFEP